MKSPNLFLIFYLILSSALAQKNVTLGKPYAVIDADQKFYFTHDGEILTVKTTRKSVTLQKLNAVDLTFQKIKLYVDFPKDFQIEKVTEIKGRYYMFYSVWDGDNEQLFVREIDFVGGSFISAGKILFTVNERISGALTTNGFWRLGVSDKFDFYFSYDSSSMVVQYRLKPEIKNDSKNYDVVGTHVFDQNLQEKWSAKLKMPYTEKKMDNMDYTVSANGDVYMVARVYNDDTTDDRKRGEEEANYHLEILKAVAPSGAISTTKIDIADKFIKTIWLYESANDYMIAGGFYNSGKNLSSVDGVIAFKLSKDSKMYDLTTHEIPVEVLNQYATRKEKRKNERKDDDDRAEFENLRLQQIDVQADGSIVLLSEQIFMLAHTRYNSSTGNSSTYYSYHCNNILVTKITTDGKLAWIKKIPKRQVSGSGYGSMSYTYFRGIKEHYFMFLDNENNLNLPVTEAPAIHSDGAGGFLMACKIDDTTGAVAKISLLDTRNINGMEVFQLQPNRILTTAPSTIVFEAYKKKKEDILVKIVLE